MSDSRGNPMVEAEIRLEGGAVGRVIVPLVALIGAFEAMGARDGGCCDHGTGEAAEYINTILAGTLLFEDAFDRGHINWLLCTANNLGQQPSFKGQCCLMVSLAVARACAAQMRQPRYRFLG